MSGTRGLPGQNAVFHVEMVHNIEKDNKLVHVMIKLITTQEHALITLAKVHVDNIFLIINNSNLKDIHRAMKNT